MAVKIKKVIEHDIREHILVRLSSQNPRAAAMVSKVVRSCSKEIAKKFIKALENDSKPSSAAKSAIKSDSTKTKKVVSIRKTASKKKPVSKVKGKK